MIMKGCLVSFERYSFSAWQEYKGERSLVKMDFESKKMECCLLKGGNTVSLAYCWVLWNKAKTTVRLKRTALVVDFIDVVDKDFDLVGWGRKRACSMWFRKGTSPFV